MTTPLPPSSGSSNPNESQNSEGTYDDFSEDIDLSRLFARLRRGVAATLGLAAIGLAFSAGIYLVASPLTTSSTSMRVAFAFSGFGRGEYPDHSKFQPDDLLAPDIIAEALKRQGLEATSGIQGKVRAALDIEGIIPANVTKDRDRLRAAGQTPAPYIPDEYLVTLTLPRKTMFSSRQCELLLGEIATVFTEKFRRNYGDTPAGFGSAFDSLRKADYFEYDLLLSADIQNVISFLNQQQDIAKTFR